MSLDLYNIFSTFPLFLFFNTKYIFFQGMQVPKNKYWTYIVV